MPIQLDYTPFQAVLDSGMAIGYGRNRQQQFENRLKQDQFDLQAQNAAADQQYRQQALAQQAQGRNQQAALQYDQMAQRGAMAQAEMMQRGQMQQAAMFERELQTKYGLYADQMRDVTRLELEGFQYSPGQQMQLEKLDSDYQSALSDEAVGPRQREFAQQQYFQKRSVIRPSRPKPKSAKERFAESLVDFVHPETGETVFGTLGERAGAVTLNQIDFEGPKAKAMEDKAAFEREKHVATMDLKQREVEAKAASLELQQQQAEIKLRQQQEMHEQKMREADEKRVKDAYTKMRAEQDKIRDQAAKASAAGQEFNAEARIKAREEAFWDSYGSDAEQHAPDIFKNRNGKKEPFTSSGPKGVHPSDYTKGVIPTINSPEEAAKLKPGTLFLGPDGQIHKVP